MIIIDYYIENATQNTRTTFQRNIWTKNTIEKHVHTHTHTNKTTYFKVLTAIEMNKQWMKMSPCRSKGNPNEDESLQKRNHDVDGPTMK